MSRRGQTTFLFLHPFMNYVLPLIIGGLLAVDQDWSGLENLFPIESNLLGQSAINSEAVKYAAGSNNAAQLFGIEGQVNAEVAPPPKISHRRRRRRGRKAITNLKYSISHYQLC
jgi:hypothetical protein